MPVAVIASAAKQSIPPLAARWIASAFAKASADKSSLRSLAQTLRESQAMTGGNFERSQYPLALPQCFGYHRTMKSGPDISMVAALVGDPARSNMLQALMTGRALPASELAQEAGITPQTGTEVRDGR